MTSPNFPPPIEGERDRLRAAMMRLPNATAARVDRSLGIFCDALALYRRDSRVFWMGDDPRRKPEAFIITHTAGDVYVHITGNAVRRRSKAIAGMLGLQEDGDFAHFLTEVFTVLGIKARAAGQVKMLMATDSDWQPRPFD